MKRVCLTTNLKISPQLDSLICTYILVNLLPRYFDGKVNHWSHDSIIPLIFHIFSLKLSIPARHFVKQEGKVVSNSNERIFKKCCTTTAIFFLCVSDLLPESCNYCLCERLVYNFLQNSFLAPVHMYIIIFYLKTYQYVFL